MSNKAKTNVAAKTRRTFYIGMGICDHYAVHIIDGEYEEKELVSEENLKGFIQCLEFFGYR